MSLRGKEQVESDPVNVVSLFGNFNQEFHQETVISDPLADLIKESEIEDVGLKTENVLPRKVVSENNFPDQSLFILEEQLANLKSSINRMKFYIDELDDIILR